MRPTCHDNSTPLFDHIICLHLQPLLVAVKSVGDSWPLPGIMEKMVYCFVHDYHTVKALKPVCEYSWLLGTSLACV